MARKTRTCPICGKPFPPGRGNGYRTCSTECGKASSAAHLESTKKRVEKPCEVCGKIMHIWPSVIEHRKTCSRECMGKALAAAWAMPGVVPRRTCVVCGKPTTGKRRTCGDECSLAAQRAWVAASSTVGARSEAVRVKRRAAVAKSYRGKDKAAVMAALTKKQRGRCRVCGREGMALGNGKKGLVLDHCHATGKARAMLCGPCNAALGLLGESPARIKALSDYAQTWAQGSLI